MRNNLFKKDEELDQSVYESHITTYLDKIKSGLFTALCFITVTEFIIFILVKNGLLTSTFSNLFIRDRWTANSAYINRYLINLNILNWLVYIVYYFLNRILSYNGRKLLACTVFLIFITLYAFGHLGFIHLSILYTISIIFTCPLGRKYHIGTLVISIIMTSIYTIYQYSLMGTEYNFLVGLISFIAIIITYLICNCVYSSFLHALIDVEQYSKLSTKLLSEISHDYVTGALSKVALYQDIAKDNRYCSIAFIDLDNFKTINDTKGHSIGDNVLNTLVKSFENKNERIYRFGGDEFIVLSRLAVYDLYARILLIKNNFTNACKKQLDCNATFSAGIKSISPDKKIEDIISETDGIMYISKKNGKDQVTVAE